MENFVRDTSTSIPVTDMERLSREIRERLAQKDVKVTFNARENEQIHGTWMLEQQMLSYIREGNTAGMRRLFDSLSQQNGLIAGALADTPLRQEKNIFIGLAALVGKTAAIEGGLDVEEAYRLVDLYTQECEASQMVEEIFVLRYFMIMDFTERVQQVRLPESISPETAKAMHFINEHIYGRVSIDSICTCVGVSRSSLTKKFGLDMGRSIGEYITEQKMREAQRLLRFSDRTISEIAEVLNYSSQPHFQTVFRRYMGTTPAKFREREKARPKARGNRMRSDAET